MLQLDVGERDVADHRVELGQLRVAEVLDADVGTGVQYAGDPAGDAVQFHADEAVAGGGAGHKTANSGPGFKDDRGIGHAEPGQGVVHGRHDHGRREELGEYSSL